MIPLIETAQIADRRELLDMLATAFRDDNPSHAEFDFLYPDLFADEAMACHRIIRQDGRIVACVGCYPQTLRLGPVTVEMFGIGQVSCLKAYRERGFMTALMTDAVARMEAASAPMSWLGGRRDRYAHFGYEVAGTACRCRLSRKTLAGGEGAQRGAGVSPALCDPLTRSLWDVKPSSPLRTGRIAGETPTSRYDFAPHTPADISDTLWSLYTSNAVRCVYPQDEWLRKLARGGPQTIWTASLPHATAPAAFAVTAQGSDYILEYGGEFNALHALLTMLAECNGRGGVSLTCCPGATEFADFFWTHAEWVSPELLNLRVHHLAGLLNAYRPLWAPHVPDGESATLVMHRNHQAETTEQRFTISQGPAQPGEELHLDDLQMVRLLFGPWPPSMTTTLPPHLRWLGQIFPLPFGVPAPSHV